jgi:hypothetical protein
MHSIIDEDGPGTAGKALAQHTLLPVQNSESATAVWPAIALGSVARAREMVPGELGLCRRGINYLLGAARTKSIATTHKLTPAKEHACCIIEKLTIYEMMRLKFLEATNMLTR